MYKEKKILAVISARGGSKEVPKKNIKELAGQPLISYTINESKLSKYIDKLIVSTDDQDIKKVSEDLNCEVPFLRPKYLSSDSAKSVDLLKHAYEFYEEKYDYLVLLQPTSPFRKYQDIDKCIRLCIDQKVTSAVTISETAKTPFWMYTLKNQTLSPVIQSKKKISRRQDVEKVYSLNGSVYVLDANFLSGDLINEDTLGVIVNSLRSMDLDSEIDFLYSEFLILNNHVQIRKNVTNE